MSAEEGARPDLPGIELAAELGRGAMGVVYRGRQTFLGREVAVKLIHRNVASDDYRKRFEREARIQASLSHPHIVTCFEAGTADGICYLVMELIRGDDLTRFVRDRGPLPVRAALRVIRELALGLAHALDRGVIHRDMKPENVLLAPLEGSDARASSAFPHRALVVDMGLARPDRSRTDVPIHLTAENMAMGTPQTMAPEQVMNPAGVDHRADIYGLGCVLYFALTGAPAFQGESASQVMVRKALGEVPDARAARADLPPPINELIQSMLATDRRQRPQTYDALIERIDALLAGDLPGPAPADDTPDGDPGAARREEPDPPVAPEAVADSATASTAEVPAPDQPEAVRQTLRIVTRSLPVRPRRRRMVALALGALVLASVALGGGWFLGRDEPGTPIHDIAFRDPAPLFDAAATAPPEASRAYGAARWSLVPAGLAVRGSGSLVLPRPAPTFQVDAFLIPGSALEVSIGLVLADGSATALRVRNLGALYVGVDDVAPLGPDGVLREAREVRMLMGLGVVEVVHVRVAAAGSQARFEVEGAFVKELALASPPEALRFGARDAPGGAAVFRNLRVRLPR